MTTLQVIGVPTPRRQLRSCRSAARLFGAALCGLLLAFPAFAQTTTYVYTGPFFDDLRAANNPPGNPNDPSDDPDDYIVLPSGDAMRVTGCFTTAAPLEDNTTIALRDIFGTAYNGTGLVRSYAFNDGRTTLAYRAQPGSPAPGIYDNKMLHFNDLEGSPPLFPLPYSWPVAGGGSWRFEFVVLEGEIEWWNIELVNTPVRPPKPRDRADYYKIGDTWYDFKTAHFRDGCCGDWSIHNTASIKECTLVNPINGDCAGYTSDWVAVGSEPGNHGSWTRIDGPNDADGDSVCDITSPPDNNPPTAVAGDDYSIRAGDSVELIGGDSYDDNTATENLDYSWSIVESPSESDPSLDAPTTISPTFISDANIPGSYTIQLIVTDEGGLSSEPDTVLISTANLAPTANAGVDQLVVVGDTVLLDGSGSSDPELDELTYEWSLTVPTGSSATLSNNEVRNPDFIADEAGTYEATLRVSDFIGPGAADDVIITAALSAEDYIVLTAEIVAALDTDQVTTKGNQRAFSNFLSQAIRANQEGDTAEAIKKLEDAMQRTDGCVLRGAPDGNGKGRDWITDCVAQASAYEPLSSALNAINP